MKFNEDISNLANTDIARNQFTVLVNGRSNSVTSSDVTGSVLTLTLDKQVESGDVVSVAYAAVSGSELTDADSTSTNKLFVIPTTVITNGSTQHITMPSMTSTDPDVAGELSLNFVDSPLKLLTADSATEEQQTAKKTAIKNAFTITTEENGGGTTLTGAVTGVQSLSANELKLEISQTILSELNVESGDRLYLNFNGAANVLEGDNDVDVLSFSQEFRANLSELANFQSGSYAGNEFHLTFTDQQLQGGLDATDQSDLMAKIKLYSDAGFNNQIKLNTNGTLTNALTFVDVTGPT